MTHHSSVNALSHFCVGLVHGCLQGSFFACFVYPFMLRSLDNMTKFELTPEMQEELKGLMEKVRRSPGSCPTQPAASFGLPPLHVPTLPVSHWSFPERRRRRASSAPSQSCWSVSWSTRRSVTHTRRRWRTFRRRLLLRMRGRPAAGRRPRQRQRTNHCGNARPRARVKQRTRMVMPRLEFSWRLYWRACPLNHRPLSVRARRP